MADQQLDNQGESTGRGHFWFAVVQGLLNYQPMERLKNLQGVISPLNSLLIWLAVYPAMYILFRPTLIEFVVMVAADLFALAASGLLERKLFFSLFPDTVVYFRGISDDDVRAMSTNERVALIESFARFPFRRAVYLYLVSFPKVALPVALIVFYWHHSVSNLAQFGLITLVAMVNFCYFYGTVFLDSHVFLSRRLQELHAAVDLTEAFQRCQIRYSKNEFEIQEFLNLAFMIIFMISLELVLIGTGQYTSTFDLCVKSAAISGFGLILFSRIWWMGRQLFIGGLETLFSQMGDREQSRSDQTLALHTSPILAHFEKTYNGLVQRIRSSEQELSSLVIHKAEENRYRALGEMSAVIAHDLSTPLHAAQFWTQELIENPSHQRQAELLGRVAANVKHATELTMALRAKVRNPDGELKNSSLKGVHQNVLRLLEVQILKTDFKRIRFVFDPRLADLNFEIPATDLTHIIDNVYRNSVNNFLQNSIANPSLVMTLVDIEGEYARIAIQDNGTGLSSDDFEDLTSFNFTRRADGSGRSGLGLRLTRRLIELHAGSLNLLPIEGQPGTCFILRLKQSHAPNKNSVEPLLTIDHGNSDEILPAQI